MESISTIEEFKENYFNKLHDSYYSRHALVELGFTYEDTAPYSEEEIREEYETYKKDPAGWLKEYES